MRASPILLFEAGLTSGLALLSRIEGFHYGGWVTFITSAWFCVCAGLELATSSESKRKGAWRVRLSLHMP